VQSPAEVAERTKQEVYATLREIANYQYDPVEYKRKVRERQGWQDDILGFEAENIGQPFV